MHKITMIFLVISVLFTSCDQKVGSTTFIIKNAIDLDRASETIAIHGSDLGIEDLSNKGIKDANGIAQTVQYVDENDDHIIDVLLFQPTMVANNESKFEVFDIPKDQKKEVVDKCYSRFVPERTDDYTWENDKVAFRVFGPKAQQMYEDGIEGGTLSSGIDCWLKRVDYPIINKWYKKELEQVGSYHEDTGEGLDNYHVGKSRGCGGLAIKGKDGYYFSKNYANYKTLMTGPIRTSFFIEYEDWDANGKTIKESMVISLDLGSYLSKMEVAIEGSDNVSLGLTLHDKKGSLTTNSENNWMSHWETLGDSELGSGIVTTPNTLINFDKYEVEEADLSNAYMNVKVDGIKVVYYAGFGWKKQGRFNTAQDWNNYLTDFSKKIASPMKVIYTSPLK